MIQKWKKLLSVLLTGAMLSSSCIPVSAQNMIEQPQGDEISQEEFLTSEEEADFEVVSEVVIEEDEVWQKEAAEFEAEVQEEAGETMEKEPVTVEEGMFPEEMPEILIGAEKEFAEKEEQSACTELEAAEDNIQATISENKMDTISVSENDIFQGNRTNVLYSGSKEECITETALEEIITLKSEGETLGRFSKWSDAVAAVKTAQKDKEYIFEISGDIKLEENLTVPANIKRLIIRGSDTEENVTVVHFGDIKLLSDVSLESVNLKAEKYNKKTQETEEYFCNVSLNGKELSLIGSSINVGKIGGNNKSVWSLTDSTAVIKNTVSGIATVRAVRSNIHAGSISNIAFLSMTSAVLESRGKISLKNIISNDEHNRIIFADTSSKQRLNISGRITSETELGNGNVYYKKNTDGEIAEYTTLVRKNALSLQIVELEENGYQAGTLLADVPKSGAAWFVIGSQWEKRNDEEIRVVTAAAYKKGTKLYCGNIQENVILSSSDKEADYVLEGYFSTLQDAFNEIDKLGNNEKYYHILLDSSKEDAAVYADKSLVFPSKTKGILISSASQKGGNLYFKGNLSLKSNAKFENIIFRNTGKSSLLTGKFSLHLKNCYSNENSYGTEFYCVTGSGVKTGAELILEDTVLEVSSNVTGIGRICFLSSGSLSEQTQTAAKRSAVSVQEVVRIIPAYPELIARGKMEAGDIILDTDAKITGTAQISQKNDVIKSIAANMTVRGIIKSEEAGRLYIDLQKKEDDSYVRLDLTSEQWENFRQKKGIQIVKAPAAVYPHVYLFGDSQQQLIKKGGYLTYFDKGSGEKDDFYGAEVSFMEGNEKVTICCYDFSDAVAEINQQKTKRDYIITLKEEIWDISSLLPKTLKFPTKKYINSLILRGETEKEKIQLGYLGNIAFTCPVTLENVSLVQMTKKGKVYKSMKEVKNDHPGIVTVKTGGFSLTVEGEVTFDTPLKIDGGKTGSLFIKGRLNTLTNDHKESMAKNNSVIYGMFSNLHTLSLSDQTVSLRAVKKSRTGNKYTASTNSIKQLYLEDGSLLEITGNTWKNSLSNTELRVANSTLQVAGNGSFKNITLEGESEAVIRADQIFTITGNINVNTDNGRLETRRKGKLKAPYLNVSGQVKREEGRNPLYVGVYPEITAGEYVLEEAVRLGGESKSASQLLTAKKAAAGDFRPIEENYPGGEYSQENTAGYILKKESGKIYVYAGKK